MNNLIKTGFFTFLLIAFLMPQLEAQRKACWLLTFRTIANNPSGGEDVRGAKFLINENLPWRAPCYDRQEDVNGILDKIKKIGIDLVILDCTNGPFSENCNRVQDQIECLAAIRKGYGMHEEVSQVNEKAKTIWNEIVQYGNYFEYNGKPALILFGWHVNEYKNIIENAPDYQKTYLDKFTLCWATGTPDVDSGPMWGFRYQAKGDMDVKYCSPEGNFTPVEIWKERIFECFNANDVSVFGGYDDVSDDQMWGIADTQNAEDRNKYPQNDPYAYYNVLEDALGNNLNNREHSSYEDALSVWPNPVNGDLNIHYSFKPVTVKLMNLCGQIIFQRKYMDNNVKLNTRDISEGIYVLNLTNGNRSLNRKIIIRKW